MIATDPILVRAGRDQRVEVTLPPATELTESVTVTATAVSAPDEVKTSSYLVTGAEISRSAGALQDVSRYVQTLPGVAIGSDDFRNDLIVRGGSPLENVFLVDNVEVPNINTFANFASAGGTVSILDSEMIRDVTFLTGGYPAPYPNRASSVLQIAQREGDRDHLRGMATVGFAGAGTVLEGPLGRQQRGSWIVSFRRSFLDLVTKDVGFGGVPVLYTFNARATYDLGPSDRLWAVNLSGVDNIRLGLTDARPPDDEVFNFDIRYQGWRSASGVNWQHLFGSRGVGLLGVTHSEAHVDSTVKDLVRDGVPPAGIPADVVIGASPVIFEERSREGESTVKYDLTTSIPSVGRLQVGGSVKRFDIDYQTASPLGDDSPYSPVRGVNPFSLTGGLRAWQSGAYVQWSRDLSPRLNVTAGGRVDSYHFLDATRVSPRAGVSYKVTDRVTASASYGRYAQQPPFLFLAAFPENRRLAPIQATHYVGGVAYTPSPSTRVSVEAYRKNYSDYPVSTQFPTLSLANIGDTFNVQEVLFPLTSTGVGRAYGVELAAERKQTQRWYGLANLAFARAQHAGLDGTLRAGSFEYPRNPERDRGNACEPPLGRGDEVRVSGRPAVHAVRRRAVAGARPRDLRSDPGQCRARAGVRPARSACRPDARDWRIVGDRVRRRAERHEPSEPGRLHVEPADQLGRTQQAARHLPHRGAGVEILTRPFDAVLVVAFGGPQGLDDIRPFLANVLRGRRVTPERIEEVAHHYERFGGVSPLTAITRRQADGLRDRLAARGLDLPVYLGMRNWHPLLPDTLQAMARDGVRRAVGFLCAAHRSYSSCTQYRQNVADARGAAVAAGFADVAGHLRQRLARARSLRRRERAPRARGRRRRCPRPSATRARLVFTAHSLPVSMPGAARYQQQLLGVGARWSPNGAGRADWALVFQSRSGRPEDPWLGPDVCDYLRAEHAAGLEAAVLCPIGFLCDHVEVLYDLDVEAADAARAVGLPLARAEAVNDDPGFLDMMADVVAETYARYERGVPLPITPL